MRVPFGKILLASVAAALLVAAPAAAGSLTTDLPLAEAPTFMVDLAAEALVAADVAVTEMPPADAPAAEPAPREPTLNDAVLAEINFARAHPQDYARRLLLQPVSDWERGLADRTDPAAVAEAIAFLQRQAPLPPLRPDDRLTAAALEHVAAQGAAGQTGHEGSNGEAFDARLRRHGVEAQMWGENIAYGPTRPGDVVRELIIDSGVPDRGHRRNIFYATFDTAGVSCGPHRDYAAMCVMDFASRVAESERKGWRQADLSSGSQPASSLLRRLRSWW